MPEIRKRQGLRRFLSSPLFCIILLVVAGLLGKALYGLYFKVEASGIARKQAGEELGAVLERKAFVEGEIRRLKTSEGMEEEIREKFNVVKPGEQVVLLETDPPAAPVAAPKSLFQSLEDKLKAMLYFWN